MNGQLAGYHGVVDDLAANVQNELSRINYALPGISAEVIPADMQVTASNTTGAYLKSAFWLARAARLARTANKSSWQGLYNQAKSYYDRSAPSLLTTYNPFRLYAKATGASSENDPKAIAQIFYQAGTMASQAGVPNVSQQLVALSTIGGAMGIEVRQEQQYGQSATDYSPMGLVKHYKNYIIAGAVLWLSVQGLLLYLAWRNRGKIASAGKTAASVGSMFLI